MIQDPPVVPELSEEVVESSDEYVPVDIKPDLKTIQENAENER